MAFHPIKPEGSTTGRGPSRTLWNQSRYGEIMMDPNAGYIFCPFDDFVTYDEKYHATVTNGTIDIVGKTGGTDTASGGYGVAHAVTVGADGDAATFRQAATDETTDGAEPAATSPLLLATGTRVVFEARLQLITLSSSGEFAFGVGKNDTLATATGIAAAQDFVGFTNYSGSSLSATNLYAATTDGASAQDEDDTSVLTIADGTTWYKIGCIIEGTSKARFFVDGEEKTAVESTTLPDGNESLGMFASVISGGAASAFKIDWWYGVQSFRKN